MDIFMKCGEYTAADRAREAGLYPYFIPLTNNEGPEARIGDHHLIMIGSNNYLGLTVHPKVRQAAMDAVALYGTSCTGSRFLNGTLELHLELERRLAAQPVDRRDRRRCWRPTHPTGRARVGGRRRRRRDPRSGRVCDRTSP